MSEQEKESTEQPKPEAEEDDVVICATCGAAVGNRWIGTHRFLTHGIERRQQSSTKPPSKRSKQPPSQPQEGEPPKKRRASVYFGESRGSD